MAKKWNYARELKKAKNRKKYGKKVRPTRQDILEAKKRGCELFKTPAPGFENCITLRADTEKVLKEEIDIQESKGWFRSDMIGHFGDDFLAIMLPKKESEYNGK